MTQPEALRLSDELDRGSYDAAMARTMARAATELCRLHAENRLLHERHHGDNVEYTRVLVQRDALLKVLKELTGHTNERFSGGVWDRARAVIKAVEQGEAK